MKVTTIVKVVIWFFLYLIIFNTSLAMISAPNTIEVIFGLLLFIAAIIVTFKPTGVVKKIMDFLKKEI